MAENPTDRPARSHRRPLRCGSAYLRNGQVRLVRRLDLPDGTEVWVAPRPKAARRRRPAPSPRPFAERFAEFIGCLKGLPRDFARNHDHYIHGTAKRR